MRGRRVELRGRVLERALPRSAEVEGLGELVAQRVGRAEAREIDDLRRRDQTIVHLLRAITHQVLETGADHDDQLATRRQDPDRFEAHARPRLGAVRVERHARLERYALAERVEELQSEQVLRHVRRRRIQCLVELEHHGEPLRDGAVEVQRHLEGGIGRRQPVLLEEDALVRVATDLDVGRGRPTGDVEHESRRPLLGVEERGLARGRRREVAHLRDVERSPADRAHGVARAARATGDADDVRDAPGLQAGVGEVLALRAVRLEHDLVRCAQREGARRRRTRRRLDADRVQADRAEVHLVAERERDLLVDLPDLAVAQRDPRQLEAAPASAASAAARGEERTDRDERGKASSREGAHGMERGRNGLRSYCPE